MQIQKIKDFSSSIVIIDDTFIEIDPTKLSAEASGKYASESTSFNWKELKTDLFSEINDPREILNDTDLIKRAWTAFSTDSEKYEIFTPLFEMLISEKKISQHKVGPFADDLESKGFVVKRFPDIQSAKDEIEKCKLLFIDFYLSPGTKEKMIERVTEYSNTLSSKVISTNEYRITFLMSSQLPDLDTIDQFRTVTNIKGAFFTAVDKSDLDTEWFFKEMNVRESLYKDMTLLGKYLENFSKTINDVSTELISRINAIELHDITLLNAVRLVKEEEKLGNYLNWLFSETLAAKVRENSELNKIAKSIGSIQNLPFVGTLKTKQILLDCFSEITFSYPEINTLSESIQFGDVYIPFYPAKKTNLNQFNQLVNSSNSGHSKRSKPLRNINFYNKRQLNFNKLYLVISPACDLLRCSLNHRVLCTVGRITKFSSKLSDLFDQDYIHGENRHFIKLTIQNKLSYAIVEWDTKALSTFEARELKDTKVFTKKAKLSELFSHQVKEDALSKVARIGVPVDPSHSIHYDATIRHKADRFDSPSDLFSAAVCMSSNKNNKNLLVLSSEFKAWIISEIEIKYSNNIPKFLNQFIQELQKDLISRFDLNSSKEAPVLPNGVMKLRIVDSADESNFSKSEIEMILYPRSFNPPAHI